MTLADRFAVGRLSSPLPSSLRVATTTYSLVEDAGKPGELGSSHERRDQVAPDEITVTCRGCEGGPKNVTTIIQFFLQPL